MRLTQDSGISSGAKTPRISISQAEITADLIYPASLRPARERGHAPRAERR